MRGATFLFKPDGSIHCLHANGKVRRLEGVTREQCEAYCKGALVQNAFPNLSVEDREFIVSGMTEEEWEVLFPPNKDEDEEDMFPPG